MFEMSFSNPAFLGYVNECEEDYHRSKLDQIVETFKNYNLGLYDSPYDSRIICSSYGIDFDYLSDEDFEYISNKLLMYGL
jgi:hypothetical protein